MTQFTSGRGLLAGSVPSKAGETCDEKKREE